MNYANIKYNDIANGPGTRVSLFVSGCRHHCRNCFNAEAWDFNAGEPFTEEVQDRIIEACRPSHIHGLSVLGGEPLDPLNQEAVARFLCKFIMKLPSKTVWVWTGYTYEELMQEPLKTSYSNSILLASDVLVDGEYVESLHDVSLRFKGSSNQRIIDLRRTMYNDKIVLWEDAALFASHEWKGNNA